MYENKKNKTGITRRVPELSAYLQLGSILDNPSPAQVHSTLLGTHTTEKTSQGDASNLCAITLPAAQVTTQIERWKPDQKRILYCPIP